MNVNAASLLWAVLVFLGFILSVCFHEFGHAIVAYWGGDRSVKDKGYLTLNPLKYTHPTYSIVMPLIFLLLGGLPLPGAAVYINTQALKGKAWRSAVSAAGPLATLVVAVIVAIVLQSLRPDYGVMQAEFIANNLSLSQVSIMSWLIQGLILLLELEVAGVILNLMPVPGLDGFGIIEPWLPPSIQKQVRAFSRFGVLILFAAFWVIPQFNQGFWSLVNRGVESLGVPEQLSILGFYVFRQSAQLLFFVLLVGLVIGNQLKKRWSKETPKMPSAPSDFLAKKLEKINAQLALNPDAALLASKSALLTQMERYDEALVAQEQSLALDSRQPEGWAMKGYLCQVLNQYDGAIAAYQHALELTDHNPDLWQSLGTVFVESRHYERALEAFDQALLHAPSPHQYNDILMLKSRPYFYLGRYDDCLGVLDKVLVTQPHQGAAWYNKACCYAQLGDLEQGIASLARAVSDGNESLRQNAQVDEDLNPLRSHPKYSAIVWDRA